MTGRTLRDRSRSRAGHVHRAPVTRPGTSDSGWRREGGTDRPTASIRTSSGKGPRGLPWPHGRTTRRHPRPQHRPLGDLPPGRARLAALRPRLGPPPVHEVQFDDDPQLRARGRRTHLGLTAFVVRSIHTGAAKTWQAPPGSAAPFLPRPYATSGAATGPGSETAVRSASRSDHCPRSTPNAASPSLSSCTSDVPAGAKMWWASRR